MVLCSRSKIRVFSRGGGGGGGGGQGGQIPPPEMKHEIG